MFDVAAYLRAEMARYYPEDKIDVFVQDEAYDIHVRSMGGAHVRTFHFDVGSDDDCFIFTNTVSGFVITFPIPPELGEDETPDGMTWGDLEHLIHRSIASGDIQHTDIASCTDDNFAEAPWMVFRAMLKGDNGWFLATEEFQP